MKKRLFCIYFSATDTTRRYVEALSDALGYPVVGAVNLADNIAAVLPQFTPDDVLILAAPVYGGRVPALVADRFRELRGSGAKAIAVAVFGNRDYDDALLELTDILSETGFDVVGAGAFVARHSIFPKVAAARPDDADIESLRQFAVKCKTAIQDNRTGKLNVKGKRPYKKTAAVGLCPVGDPRKCNRCGTCVRMCPVGAISIADPCKTDAHLCISCGRCINVCPVNARHYKGVKYSLVGAIFSALFSKRKEPDYDTL